MTVGQDEGEAMKRGNVVIVGMKELDAYDGRELLTCTLSNFIEAGDSVIAFHVSSPSSSSSSTSTTTSSVLHSDSMIGIYESIFSIKKVELEVKVAEGRSVKKALIEEAKRTNATKVILGYACGKSHLRSSFSLAKYCSKRLPSTCSVMVIQKGEVAFQQEGSLRNDDDTCIVLCTIQRTIRNPSKKAENRKCIPLAPLQVEVKQRNMHIVQSLGHHREDDSIVFNTSTTQILSYSKDQMASETESPSPSSSSSVSSTYSPISNQQSLKLQQHYLPEGKSDKGGMFNVTLEHCPQDRTLGFRVEKDDVDSSHVGWPLLRRSTTMVKENTENLNCHRMSVIEWALQLPDRPKEKPNPQCLLPTREEQCRIICENISKDKTPPLNSSSIGTYQCDANTITSKVESVCHNKTCREFHLLELQAATNNFSTNNMVGKGGCSEVYRGILLNGNMVAVKCINALAPDSIDEFVTEVEIVSSLHHCHIVQLIGYAVGSDFYYLVYNFASEGNLEQKLHDGNLKEILPWDARYKVAIGIAEALKYLHDECMRPVIHRDVKSSNILLDSSLKPQLTDFGLAKWAPTSSSQITCSDVVGTFGYLAPEYFMFGKVSEKTDVFSFGVVLLELITGRRPIDNGHAKGEENLEVWARPLLEDEPNLGGLIDPNLEGNYKDGQLRNMVVAASLCLRQSPQLRPRMSRILKVLHGETEDIESDTSKQDISYKDADDGFDDIPNNYNGDTDIRKHLTLALLGLDDDAASQGSIEHSVNLSHSNKYLEEYLGHRFSRSSSFQ